MKDALKLTKPIRAAIYARVSTAEQNPEAQLQELRAYVEKRGFVLHKEYVDYVSGDFAKRKKKRKQRDQAYQDLMSDASKRLIDCVIVWKYDRFARSLSVLVTALEQFNKLGIDFISYTQDMDTTTAMGRLFYNVIGSFAEFEREMIVERVNAGLANARAKGVRLGRPEKDPTAAQRIATLREEGWSLRRIAKREELSAAGVLKILRRNEEQQSSGADVAAESKPEVSKNAKVSTTSSEPKEITEICQLKIYLSMIKPKIWRRVLVRSDITLARLSVVIQNLFGWTDLFPHMFVPRDARGFGFELKCDENTFRLCDVGLKQGDGMLYEYGCLDWTHEVTFEKTARPDNEQQYPVCTAGAMAAPPEDCGGALAYMEARKTRTRDGRLRNMAKKPGLKIYCVDQWLFDFDPRRFDLDEINRELGSRSPDTNKAAKVIELKINNKDAPLSIPEVYQFKISIVGVTPQIWRRVQVKSDSPLATLSDVIVAAFDWGGYHLHKFLLPGAWGPGIELDVDESTQRLGDMSLKPQDSLLYQYDFGDDWLHEIVFEKVVRFDKSRTYPTCTAGKNAGPPEDCGGPEAYMNARNFLSRRKGRKAKAPRGRVSWSQKEFYRENYKGFDPDAFDRDEVNRQLAELSKGS